MADPELTYRAEQAYLGALIASRGQAVAGRSLYGDGRPAWFAGLRPHDFADPVHQAVYAASLAVHCQNVVAWPAPTTGCAPGWPGC